MKACLVFPPQIIPSSPPLGISLLKSYIQENLKEKVNCIDLNLHFHNKVIENFLAENFSLYKDKEKNIKSRELISSSLRIFKEKHKDFFNPALYNPCANEFLYLFERVFQSNKPLLIDFIKEKKDMSQALAFLTEKITKEKPQTLGLSILTIEQAYYALALAKQIKDEINSKIIIGGAAVRLFPENFLNYDFVDFVVLGDGERAFEGILGEKNKKDIPNLLYKEKGSIIKNEEKNVDINTIPFPDFSDFDFDDYFSPKRVITALTSRGCCWKRCTFCADYNALSMQYRAKTIQKLTEEISFLKKKYNTHYFYFADEMISPPLFKEISNALTVENLDINYYVQAKPKGFNRELLEKIKGSGCTAIMWGVESACQRILDLIDKGTDIKEIKNILQDSHSVGIKNAVYAFGGFPSETEEEYNTTLKWLNDNRDLIDIQFTGVFRLTKNSKIQESPGKFRISRIQKIEDEFEPTYDYMVKEGITQERAMQLFEKNYSFILGLNKFSPFLGKFRDHMLIYFAEHEKYN